MSEIVEKIQQKSIQMLSEMLNEVLTEAEKAIVDQIGGFLALSNHREQIIEDFIANMNDHFDELLGKDHKRREAVVDFETLSIIQEAELEVMVALEGMVAYSRNQHLPSFISFNTRLSHVVPDRRIDEATNPLDPHQIASAFQDAIRPLNMDAGNCLAVYRGFNAGILRRLDEVIHEANQLLIQDGIIPDLGMDGGSRHKPPARSKRRHYDPDSTFGTVEEEDYDAPEEQPELFSMMQNLLHGGGSQPEAPAAPQGTTAGQQPGQQYAVPAGMIPMPGTGGTMQPYVPQAGEQVKMVDQSQLMEILTSLQKAFAQHEEKAPAATRDEAEKIDIAESLDEVLKDNKLDGAIQAVDAQSSDVINLVTMLYEAIWDDESVPIPIKELIGRTQITIIRVALSDQTFFNREAHPARMLLNEFAAAGIGWTEVEKLQEDPLYRKMQEQVNRILDEYDGDVRFFEALIEDFKSFQAREAAKTRRLEQRILKATERQDRLEDIRELVTQKINERILGRDLHPFVEELLEGPFHKFMVLLVVKEGPGGNAWKQAINTIDVLLWSVQAKEHHGDRNRLETVNPRLLNNLRKAFRIASLGASDIDQLIVRLQEIQEESFEAGETESPVAESDQPGVEAESAPHQESIVSREPPAMPDLDEDNPHVKEVDNLSVGVWVQFAGETERDSIRCKLAAKINAIDKLIFVNRQGVKVVEKTRMGLAQELEDGTVRIISDGLLFSRALETVIGNLREAQQRQQTGSAYQPQPSTA